MSKLPLLLLLIRATMTIKSMSANEIDGGWKPQNLVRTALHAYGIDHLPDRQIQSERFFFF
jgi:hypothetical protein